MSHPALVNVAWLATHRTDPHVAIVDLRWYLTNPTQGAQEYIESHIAGAVYVSLDEELSEAAWDGPGRHPLPRPARFVAAMSNAGVDAQTHVVVYDSAGGSIATRLWWLLRYYGHTKVSILDGGWQAWLASHGDTRSGKETRAAKQFVGQPNPHMTVDAPTVDHLRHDAHTLLLDARARERYTGEVEPFGPRAGHIPGAHSAPFSENLTSSGTLKTPNELKARFDALGVPQAQTVVCYCGSGVTATHNLFAMHLAGYDAKLYPGSWSDWSNDPTHDIATGDQPK